MKVSESGLLPLGSPEVTSASDALGVRLSKQPSLSVPPGGSAEKDRLKGLSLRLPLIVGNISEWEKDPGKRIHSDPDRSTWFQWTAYVRSLHSEDLSYVIDRVVFHLHSTCKPPVRIVDRPPFETSYLGWGQFWIRIDIYLKHHCDDFSDVISVRCPAHSLGKDDDDSNPCSSLFDHSLGLFNLDFTNNSSAAKGTRNSTRSTAKRGMSTARRKSRSPPPPLLSSSSSSSIQRYNHTYYPGMPLEDSVTATIERCSGGGSSSIGSGGNSANVSCSSLYNPSGFPSSSFVSLSEANSSDHSASPDEVSLVEWSPEIDSVPSSTMNRINPRGGSNANDDLSEDDRMLLLRQSSGNRTLSELTGLKTLVFTREELKKQAEGRDQYSPRMRLAQRGSAIPMSDRRQTWLEKATKKAMEEAALLRGSFLAAQRTERYRRRMREKLTRVFGENDNQRRIVDEITDHLFGPMESMNCSNNKNNNKTATMNNSNGSRMRRHRSDVTTEDSSVEDGDSIDSLPFQPWAEVRRDKVTVNLFLTLRNTIDWEPEINNETFENPIIEEKLIELIVLEPSIELAKAVQRGAQRILPPHRFDYIWRQSAVYQGRKEQELIQKMMDLYCEMIPEMERMQQQWAKIQADRMKANALNVAGSCNNNGNGGGGSSSSSSSASMSVTGANVSDFTGDLMMAGPSGLSRKPSKQTPKVSFGKINLDSDALFCKTNGRMTGATIPSTAMMINPNNPAIIPLINPDITDGIPPLMNTHDSTFPAVSSSSSSNIPAISYPPPFGSSSMITPTNNSNNNPTPSSSSSLIMMNDPVRRLSFDAPGLSASTSGFPGFGQMLDSYHHHHHSGASGSGSAAAAAHFTPFPSDSTSSLLGSSANIPYFMPSLPNSMPSFNDATTTPSSMNHHSGNHSNNHLIMPSTSTASANGSVGLTGAPPQSSSTLSSSSMLLNSFMDYSIGGVGTVPAAAAAVTASSSVTAPQSLRRSNTQLYPSMTIPSQLNSVDPLMAVPPPLQSSSSFINDHFPMSVAMPHTSVPHQTIATAATASSFPSLLNPVDCLRVVSPQPESESTTANTGGSSVIDLTGYPSSNVERAVVPPMMPHTLHNDSQDENRVLLDETHGVSMTGTSKRTYGRRSKKLGTGSSLSSDVSGATMVATSRKRRYSTTAESQSAGNSSAGSSRSGTKRRRTTRSSKKKRK